MKLNWAWLQRRFWDFRHGHSVYLSFLLSFFNFIVLNYRLLIENVDVLKGVFARLWIFGVFFLITYPPLAILIGYKFYRKRQLRTDQEITTREHPYLYKAQPGINRQLTLPINKRILEKNMELWERFNLLTPEDRHFFNEKLKLYDKLISGETIQ